MSLSNPSFIAFFAVVFALFYLLPGGRARLVLLLVTSLGFYAYLSGGYTGVLLAIIAATYAGGLALQEPAQGRRRRTIFIAALLGVLAPLIIFKYSAFLCDAVGLGTPRFVEWLVLPVGLSYFTFAAIGYLIDVNLSLTAAERNPLRLGLFVSFFPLVTSGPIERGGRLLPQLNLASPFSADRAFAGLRLIFIGLVLKVLFADALATPVAAIFGEPEGSLPLEKLFAVIVFPFNLYADFAGYSLIAIGCAKMLGIEVQPNFRQPFLSQSIPEFWRTWHMSLSFWVRDYLFTPLRAHWRRSRHLGLIGPTILSFFIIGLWHGAGWPFVILGIAFGVLAVSSLYTMKYRDAIYTWLGVPKLMIHIIRAMITFALFALVLVLFRANYLDDALLFYRDIFSLGMLDNLWTAVSAGLFHHGAPLELPVASANWGAWFLIMALVAGDILVRNGYTLERCPVWLQVITYNVGLGAIVYQWMTSSIAPPFLYYKF
ncbi:MAG TPA: MBOAT family O-acyltransferase [Stellaceae bacterium]|nr:MBOAT family O-acyltransferase [Stellaceae bacterium]